MLRRNLAFRIMAPQIFLSLLLLSLCIAAAVYLYYQQRKSAGEISENVDSRKIADELAAAVGELSQAHASNDSRQVQYWQERVADKLGRAWDYADKEEELKLVRQIKSAFDQYSQEASTPRRMELLKDPLLPTVAKLRDFNLRQIESSSQLHSDTVPWLAWGLAAVGGIGSIGGLVLGYGMAKALRHSIYQLSVRVRDAADKLGQDLPTVTLQEDGDLHHLHEQLQGMIHDIEQVVERLGQREREILRAEQLAAVGQIAAGVAHELRNPLTSIKMLVQAGCEETEARGMPADDLRIIEQEIRRMERCLQTFLDFARPPKPERKPLALATVVDRTLDLIGGRAKKQGVAVEFDAPEAPLIVEADGEQFQQVLINVALNALDAMPRGGRLAIKLYSAADNSVELRVEDSGPGIPPHIAPRLFEPFVSGKETGLGLGLVISRRIVENHGGTITAANRPDSGACIRISLPLAAVTPGAAKETKLATAVADKIGS
jgi:two-component system, NtrC family, sensor histidine kinase HydH